MKKNGLFKERLQGLLTTHGLKQCEFAEKIGVDQSTVSDWLSSKAEPKYTQIQKIVDVFHVNPQVLFDWK